MPVLPPLTVRWTMDMSAQSLTRDSVVSHLGLVQNFLLSDCSPSSGSCVAFANMAAIETCFHKITGVFGDYSEQQMVDCGYDGDTANGCNGASPHAYIKWAAESKPDLTAEVGAAVFTGF